MQSYTGIYFGVSQNTLHESLFLFGPRFCRQTASKPARLDTTSFKYVQYNKWINEFSISIHTLMGTVLVTMLAAISIFGGHTLTRK